MVKSSASRFFLALGLFPSFVVSAAFAAHIVMDNGDRLTGELVGEDEEALQVQVEYLGELRLPKSRIQNLEELLATAVEHPTNEALAAVEESAVQAEAQAQAEAEGEDVPPGEPAVVEIREAESTDAVMVGYAQFFKSLMPFHDWDKTLQLGMTSQSGRKDKTDINYRYDMQYKGERNQYRFKAEYLYGKTGTVQTSDKVATDFRWRQDIGPGVFYETTSSYNSDKIKYLDSNVEQKLGIGTRFLDNDTMTLSSGLGASGRWRDFSNEKDEEVAYLVDLFQDWDYRINDRLRLRQDMRFAVPLEERDEYEYSFTASLVSEISKAVNFSLRYELGYDNSLEENLRSDRRFISTVGYKF